MPELSLELNPLVGQLHNRMPVLLEEPEWPLWLAKAMAIQPCCSVRQKRAPCGR